jgi:hypothetical protein
MANAIMANAVMTNAVMANAVMANAITANAIMANGIMANAVMLSITSPELPANLPIFFPVDGNWTDWIPATNCSQSICGPGFLILNRSCSNPEPKFNGSDCVGNATTVVSCQVETSMIRTNKLERLAFANHFASPNTDCSKPINFFYPSTIRTSKLVRLSLANLFLQSIKIIRQS